MIGINGWELQRMGKPIALGAEVTDFRGEKATLEAGYPPKHSASEGFVDTSKSRYVYAGVYNLKWVKKS